MREKDDTGRAPRSGLSAISIVKNATVLDFPVEAALRSALPLVDELIVNVGESEDDTLERIRAIGDPKLRIHTRAWPSDFGSETLELSDETNWALDLCENDWVLYLQADEVLHEDDYAALGEALARAGADPDVEGLLFDYHHFHGSPDWEVYGRLRYRREVRIIRRSSGVRSTFGAQGFREGNRKPRVIRSGARVFHYGYLKSDAGMWEKKRLAQRYWGKPDVDVEPFVFERISGLRRFEGSHPAVVREWIDGREWSFDPRRAAREGWSWNAFRVRFSDAIEARTGVRIREHRNYELIR